MALKLIRDTLKDMGYADDNQRMIHDYLHFMLMDLLDKNGEVYLTEDDVRAEPTITALLNGYTPDLIVKSRNKRDKPLIVDIYIGKKSSAENKKFYEQTTAFFADLCVVTKSNFVSKMREHNLLPIQDAEYIDRHLQGFLVEHQYWQACIKLRRVISNEVENFPIEILSEKTAEQETDTQLFKASLTTYASCVTGRKGL